MGDQFGSKTALRVGTYLITLPMLLWLAVTPERIWPILPIQLLGGLGWGAYSANLNNLVLKLAPPERRPSFVAALGAVSGTGEAVAPLAGGAILTGLQAPRSATSTITWRALPTSSRASGLRAGPVNPHQPPTHSFILRLLLLGLAVLRPHHPAAPLLDVPPVTLRLERSPMAARDGLGPGVEFVTGGGGPARAEDQHGCSGERQGSPASRPPACSNGPVEDASDRWTGGADAAPWSPTQGDPPTGHAAARAHA